MIPKKIKNTVLTLSIVLSTFQTMYSETGPQKHVCDDYSLEIQLALSSIAEEPYIIIPAYVIVVCIACGLGYLLYGYHTPHHKPL